MAIRALLFDLWGTLVDDSVRGPEPRSVTRARLAAQALEAAGYAYEQDTIAAALKAFSTHHTAINAEGRDLAPPDRVDLLLELLDQGLASRVLDDDKRALGDALAGAIKRHPPIPVPGAHQILGAARRRGLVMGLVSNTGWSSGAVLRDLLSDQGLLHSFQVLTFSDEACLWKPATGMFTCTLDALAVEAGEAVFIGDWPEADVAGALAVGMWAVQIGDHRVDGIEPHARIDTLPELFPALTGLGLLDQPAGPTGV
ncbi:MAG: HAD family hydrolase [Dehalococcoidia bacterium]